MKWLTSCVILPLSAFLNGMARILKGMARFVTAKFIEKYFKNGSLCAGYRTLKQKNGLILFGPILEHSTPNEFHFGINYLNN